VANTFPGLLLVAICLNVIAEGNEVPRPILWVGIFAGLALGVRGYRMAVVLTDGRLTVRGFVWSRTVRVADVVTVSSGAIAMLRWRSAPGGNRSSPIVAFTNPFSGLRRYSEHNRQSLRLLRLEITRAQER
jgi:hypothetical protein